MRRSGRCLFLVGLIAATAAGCRPESSPASGDLTRPPSIVFVSLDTTRADRLGPYGHDQAETPRLDDLAARGVVFDRAFTPTPVTLPAHATMLSGLLPHRHGVRDNGSYRLPDDVATFPELLRGAGYATRAVVAAEVLDRQYGLARGFDEYDDRIAPLGGLVIPERTASEVTDVALRQADGLREPFLLFVHYFDPHADYRPPEPFAGRFRGRPYDGEIAYVDQQLGRLLDGLERRGLMNETVVVVVSDHGESLGEHGEATHGVFLYQSTLHVPMILVAPDRLPAGGRVDTPVILADLAPTLLELAGLDSPENLDGRSLLAEAAGGAAVARGERWLMLESEFAYNAYGWAPLHGVTDGRLKWIGAPRPELFDLDADPEELRDLAADRPADVERLRATWSRMRGEDRRAPMAGGGTPAGESERLDRLASLGYVQAMGRRRSAGRELPDPKDVIATLATINEARALMSTGRAPDAARLLEPVVLASPGNLSALSLLGSAWILSGQPARSIPALREAARLAPSNGDVQFNLGIALSSTGDLDGAETAWREAVAVAPRKLEAVANLVDLLQSTGRSDEASAVLRRSRDAGLDGPVIDYLDGRLAFARGDRAAATELLTRAMRGSLPPQIAQDAGGMLRQLSATR